MSYKGVKYGLVILLGLLISIQGFSQRKKKKRKVIDTVRVEAGNVMIYPDTIIIPLSDTIVVLQPGEKLRIKENPYQKSDFSALKIFPVGKRYTTDIHVTLVIKSIRVLTHKRAFCKFCKVGAPGDQYFISTVLIVYKIGMPQPKVYLINLEGNFNKGGIVRFCFCNTILANKSCRNSTSPPDIRGQEIPGNFSDPTLPCPGIGIQ